MRQVRKLRVLMFSFATMMMFFVSITKIGAWEGYWSSDGRVDLNGLSEVGTTYAGGGWSSHTFLLKVAYYPNGYSVGSATKTIEKDSSASHMCWGDPMFYKYGIVDPYNANVAHLPWFDV